MLSCAGEGRLDPCSDPWPATPPMEDDLDPRGSPLWWLTGVPLTLDSKAGLPPILESGAGLKLTLDLGRSSLTISSTGVSLTLYMFLDDLWEEGGLSTWLLQISSWVGSTNLSRSSSPTGECLLEPDAGRTPSDLREEDMRMSSSDIFSGSFICFHFRSSVSWRSFVLFSK